MSLQSIRDQKVPVRLLRNIIQSGRVPNGLLFWGPEGVGKHLAAMELVKALNCKEEGLDGCGECLACRKVAHGNHADVKEIQPSGRGRVIKVAVMEELIELATYRPFEGQWRVVIVNEADRMNEGSQNHFLKTLEEPPSQTVFMLLTEFPRRLLPTIRSRCQSVRFGALRPETVADLLLRDRKIPNEVAQAIAAVSQGQMSRATALVDSDRRDVVLATAHGLATGEDPFVLSESFVAHLKAQGDEIRAAIKAEFDQPGADEYSREEREAQKEEQTALAEALIRRELMEYLYLLETWYRDALVFEATRDPIQILNRDRAEKLAESTGKDHARHIAAIEKAWRYVERNLNMDRVFRDLFFTLSS